MKVERKFNDNKVNNFFENKINVIKSIHFILESWNFQFSSVQSLSRVWLFVTPWIAARQASLSVTNSWSSLKLTSIE